MRINVEIMLTGQCSSLRSKILEIPLTNLWNYTRDVMDIRVDSVPCSLPGAVRALGVQAFPPLRFFIPRDMPQRVRLLHYRGDAVGYEA